MNIVTVSGSGKETGKSYLATYLVSGLERAAGLKVSVHSEPHPEGPLVLDRESLGTPGTDTGQLLAAGAEKVAWLRTTPDRLPSDLETALERFPDDLPLIVEGNTVTLHVEPCVAVFMMSVPVADFKPSAHGALGVADVVLLRWGEAFAGFDCGEITGELKGHGVGKVLVYRNADEMSLAFRKVLIMVAEKVGVSWLKEEMSEEVMEAVKKAAPEGRMACARAFEVARELGVEPRVVGEALDLQNIKIHSCQLGCF